MSVSFNTDELSISLRDLTDWSVYFKKYTEADIGKQIHRKIDLIDIYESFAGRPKLTDEMNVEHEAKQEMDEVEKKSEKFGELILDEAEFPCYQVNKGGEIIVYVTLCNTRSRKEFRCESQLKLDFARKMTEEEILVEKFKVEKVEMQNKFNKKIEELEDELKKVTFRFQAMHEQYEQSLKTISEKEKELKEKDKIIEEQKLSMKIQEELLQNRLAEEEAFYKEQIMLEKQNEQSLLAIENKKIKEFEQIQKQIHFVQSAKNQPCGSLFDFDGQNLKYIGDDRKWTQFAFPVDILVKTVFIFKINILKTSHRNIMVGIVDFDKQKEYRISRSSGDSICYNGQNGIIYPVHEGSGNGFYPNDIVHVKVNRINNLIEWIVNGKTKAAYQSAILADSTRVFFPYVEMRDVGDLIHWSIGE